MNQHEATEIAYNNGYKQGKADGAREIFEEIERFLYMHFRFCKEEIGNDDTEYVKGRLELNTQIQNLIAELKKKYTVTDTNVTTREFATEEKLPKAIYQSFNSHACETFYKCPICNRTFGSWSYSEQKQECPWCEGRIRIK